MRQQLLLEITENGWKWRQSTIRFLFNAGFLLSLREGSGLWELSRGIKHIAATSSRLPILMKHIWSCLPARTYETFPVVTYSGIALQLEQLSMLKQSILDMVAAVSFFPLCYCRGYEKYSSLVRSTMSIYLGLFRGKREWDGRLCRAWLCWTAKLLNLRDVAIACLDLTSPLRKSLPDSVWMNVS